MLGRWGLRGLRSFEDQEVPLLKQAEIAATV